MAESRVDSSASIPGQPMVVDRTNATFVSCESGAKATHAWQEGDAFDLRRGCWSRSPAYLPTSECEPAGSIAAFRVRFADGKEFFAEDLGVTADGRVHAQLYSPLDVVHGRMNDVRRIEFTRMCRGSTVVPGIPADFCREPRRFAVAFDYRTPLRNTIFTNGFSVFVRSVGTPPRGFDMASFSEEVRSGFQFGISQWFGALADSPSLLSPAVRDYVSLRTAATGSGGYRVQTPPQVVRLDCPDAAVFVVELHFRKGRQFPDFPLVLARAQVRGRTLALNMRVARCFRAAYVFDSQGRLPFELEDGCVNLVPILTHEIGHALGMNHPRPGGPPTLMDAAFSRDALSPTGADVNSLVAALNEVVSGAAPGVLEFNESDGVRPPAGWSPPK